MPSRVGGLTFSDGGVAQKLRLMGRKASSVALSALVERAEKTLQNAQDNYVPVDTGDLRDSGRIEIVGKMSVEIAFGPHPAALAIHEHLSEHSPPSWQHPKAGYVNFQPDGRGPKYLEKPLMETASTLLTDLAATIRLEDML